MPGFHPRHDKLHYHTVQSKSDQSLETFARHLQVSQRPRLSRKARNAGVAASRLRIVN